MYQEKADFLAPKKNGARGAQIKTLGASAAQQFYEGSRRVFEKTFCVEKEEREERYEECKEGAEADAVPAGQGFAGSMERRPQDPEDLSQSNRRVNNIVEFGAVKPHACRNFELLFANLIRVNDRVFVTHACKFAGGGGSGHMLNPWEIVIYR